jgi:hypothetical protein
MEGYDVITFDDDKIGHVVGRSGSFLIVEHGSIFKHKRPLPEAFATVDDEAQVVRATVSKNVLESAPEIRDGEVDERAAAEHYGLAGGSEEPATQGYGQLLPEDTAISAEQQEVQSGLEPAPSERATISQNLEPGSSSTDEGKPSPGIAGGDRRRDAGA